MNLWRARPATLTVVALALLGAIPATLNAVALDAAVTVGIYALIALSVGLCYGQAGILSMAQASIAAIGGYITAIVSVKLGWPPPLDLALAIALPAALAYLLARFVTRLAPLAVALATLALATLIEVVLRSWDSVTGGYTGFAGIPGIGPPGMRWIYYAIAWAQLCIFVLLYENLMHSRFGRALRTTRRDRSRAAADGVPVTHLLSSAFALSAAMAGTAGWLYAHYIAFMSPDSLGTTLSISVLLMTVIGGSGYILGPIVGAIVLTVVSRLLPAQEVQGLFYGAALVVILLVARDGILGALEPLRRRLARRRVAPEPA